MSVPPQAGSTAIVTGANRGLGFEIARELAAAGAHVVLACRDAALGRDAARRIGANAEALELDLADLASVRAFAGAVASRFARLDLLVNNASAILQPRGHTRDGFELHMGVNHLGTFALTGLLLDRLSAAPAARVVSTGSLAHKLARRLPLDDLQYRDGPYEPMEAYGRSKWATLLFTFELDRRCRQAQRPIRAVAAHPGWANTNPDRGGFFMRLANGLMAQPPDAGAAPVLHAATAEDVVGGDYFGPAGVGELRGPPRRVEARAEARDPQLGARLWKISEELTGVSYFSAEFTLPPGRRAA